MSTSRMIYSLKQLACNVSARGWEVFKWGTIYASAGSAFGTFIFGISYAIRGGDLYRIGYCNFVNANLLTYDGCSFDHNSEHGYSGCHYSCSSDATVSLLRNDATAYGEQYLDGEIEKEIPVLTLPIPICAAIGFFGGAIYGWLKPIAQSADDDLIERPYRRV